MRLLRSFLCLTVVLNLVLGVTLSVMVAPQRALAQSTPVPTETSTETPAPAGTPTPLTIFTSYPAQVIGIGETLNLSLKIRTGAPGAVALSVENAPAEWTMTFRGGGRIVSAVYADGVNDATVDLRIEPPAADPEAQRPSPVASSRPIRGASRTGCATPRRPHGGRPGTHRRPRE